MRSCRTRMNSARFRPGGIGHRVDRHVELAVERRHAGLVVAGLAGRAAVTFREDHDLAALGEQGLGPADHGLQRRGMAAAVDVDGADLGGVPAEPGDQVQLLLHHEHRTGQPGELGEDVEHAQVLGGDQGRALGDVLAPADLDPDAADPQHHNDSAAPDVEHGQRPARGPQQDRRADDRDNRRPDREQQQEEQRAEGGHARSLFCAAGASRGPSPRTASRPRIARYLQYSTTINRAAPGLRHQPRAFRAGVATG